MPATRSTVSPASDWVSGRMTGIAPATAASKYRSTWACSAACANSPVDTAISALLAVMTDLPCSSALRIALRAGSTGPMSSTTMSTLSRDTSSSMSSVSNSTGTPRSAATRRTPMPRNTSGAPMRAVRSRALSSMMRTTSLPTLPSPNTATPMGFSSPFTVLPHFQTEQIVDRLPAQNLASLPVAHGHHGGPADQVVTARHGVAVRARCGNTQQVAGGDVVGQPGVPHDDIAALTMLSDDAGQHSGHFACTRKQSHVILGAVQRRADVVAHAAVHTDVSAVRGGADSQVFDGADLVQRDGAGAGDGAAGLHHEPRRGQADRGGFIADNGTELGGQVVYRWRI